MFFFKNFVFVATVILIIFNANSSQAKCKAWEDKNVEWTGSYAQYYEKGLVLKEECNKLISAMFCFQTAIRKAETEGIEGDSPGFMPHAELAETYFLKKRYKKVKEMIEKAGFESSKIKEVRKKMAEIER